MVGNRDIIFGGNDYHVIASSFLNADNLSRKTFLTARAGIGMAKLSAVGSIVSHLNKDEPLKFFVDGVQYQVVDYATSWLFFTEVVKSLSMSVNGRSSKTVGGIFSNAMKYNRSEGKKDKELKEE